MPVLQFDLFGIFASPETFLIFFIIIGGLIGLISRKLSIVGYGGILTYGYVVLNTDLFIFDAILYLVLFIIALWASAYVVESYMGNETEGE